MPKGIIATIVMVILVMGGLAAAGYHWLNAVGDEPEFDCVAAFLHPSQSFDQARVKWRNDIEIVRLTEMERARYCNPRFLAFPDPPVSEEICRGEGVVPNGMVVQVAYRYKDITCVSPPVGWVPDAILTPVKP